VPGGGGGWPLAHTAGRPPAQVPTSGARKDVCRLIRQAAMRGPLRALSRCCCCWLLLAMAGLWVVAEALAFVSCFGWHFRRLLCRPTITSPLLARQ
jgi:hypothetical protein